MSRPAHHGPSGRFRNPWPEAAGDDELRKRFREVAWAWVTRPMPPNPDPGALPLGQSEVAQGAPQRDQGFVRIERRRREAEVVAHDSQRLRRL